MLPHSLTAGQKVIVSQYGYAINEQLKIKSIWPTTINGLGGYFEVRFVNSKGYDMDDELVVAIPEHNVLSLINGIPVLC